MSEELELEPEFESMQRYSKKVLSDRELVFRVRERLETIADQRLNFHGRVYFTHDQAIVLSSNKLDHQMYRTILEIETALVETPICQTKNNWYKDYFFLHLVELGEIEQANDPNNPWVLFLKELVDAAEEIVGERPLGYILYKSSEVADNFGITNEHDELKRNKSDDETDGDEPFDDPIVLPMTKLAGYLEQVTGPDTQLGRLHIRYPAVISDDTVNFPLDVVFKYYTKLEDVTLERPTNDEMIDVEGHGYLPKPPDPTLPTIDIDALMYVQEFDRPIAKMLRGWINVGGTRRIVYIPTSYKLTSC